MKKLLFLFLILFTTQSFATMMCEDFTDYWAEYTLISYTCQSGYFLPANTRGCQPCPDGYTCAGGTFDFNENIYQGAQLNGLTTTVNNVCADNFPTDLYADYTPNTINLNWYLDESATTPMTVPTASQHCTYDTKIVLPPEPTRPGYIFSGWRLRKNN